MVRFTVPTKSKGPVEIEIDDDDQIVVWTPQGARIGHVTSRRIEGEPETGLDDVVKITNMYLDGPDGSEAFKFQGIGRDCVRLLGEHAGCTVVASYPDGQVQEDGSHLTGDAPGFMCRMNKEGLISWANAPDDEGLDQD